MDPHSVNVNPQELRRAQAGWASFTRMTKYAALTIIALLILMAAFLV
jgi:hypothetical protein